MPLTLSDQPLSFGMQGDDVACVHGAIEALGRLGPLHQRTHKEPS
jgi:hypothetical protein